MSADPLKTSDDPIPTDFWEPDDSQSDAEYIKSISSLKDLLDNERSYDKITAKPNINRVELFLMILKLAGKCGLSHSGFGSLV